MIMKASGLIQSELEELSLFINQHYGLEFRHQRLELLQEAVQKRMEARKLPTVGEYWNLIQQQEAEVLHLISLLTVHETYFFREPKHLDIMTRQVLPRLVKNGGQYPFLRMLSAGCSTGEEAYSMAIAALKMPGAGIHWDFEVIGVDVDQEAIKKAQTGLYGLYSFRSCPEEIRNRYFERMSPENFRIKNLVKEKVRFESLNLFQPVYPDWMQSIDIVFYRNVSIYFSKEQREAVFRRLAGLLNHDGCLFMSCTETLYHHDDVISLVKKGQTFCYKKQDVTSIDSHATVARKIATGNRQYGIINKPRNNIVSHVKKWSPTTERVRFNVTSNEQRPLVDNRGDQCQQMFIATLELVKLKKYDEAIKRLDEIIAIDSFFIKAHTLKANILLNQQSVKAAIEICQATLIMDEFCLEAYLLLGMAEKLVGQMEQAIRRFKEAVYVQPECWLAHFFLAQVYQLREEWPYAKREYEVAMGILKQGKFESHGLSFFSMPFQIDDFIQLCQHNIAPLKD